MKVVKTIMMAMALFFIVLIIGIAAEAVIGVRFNMAGIGSIVSIALVGAVTLYVSFRKNR